MRWRWKVCAFLLAATALSYLDRQALSIAAPVVRREMNLDNAQLGLLLSAFFWSYSLGNLVVGYLLDRLPMRQTYTAFVALWSLSQACGGLVTGFQSLFTARVFLGGFEAAGQTGAARILASIMDRKDRPLANGIMMSGGSLGAMIAPPLMIWLTNTIGWRYGFVVLGAAGIVWAVAWMSFRAPLPQPENVSRNFTDDDRWSNIIRSQRFWACVGGAIFGTPIIHISSAWIPTYFAQHWNLPLSAGLGAYLFFIYLGLDLGFLAGGAATTLLGNRGVKPGRSRKIVLTGAGVFMTAAAAVPLAQSVSQAVMLVFLMNFGRAAYGANYLAFNQEIAPNRVGTLAGMMAAIGALSGAILVWQVGQISKSSGFTIPFLMIGALAVLGLLPLLLVSWDSEEHA